MSTSSSIVSVKLTKAGQPTCSCDQYFDSALGQCAPLTPNAISVPSLVQKYPFWILYHYCGFGGAGASTCIGYEGENLSECNFYKTGGSSLCNSNNYSFRVTGQVLSGGTPVCNQKLTWTTSLPSNLTLSWHTPDGYFEGSFVISYALDGNTDSQGNFSAEFTVEVANVKTNIDCANIISPPTGQKPASIVSSWTMGVALTADPNIKRLINIELQTTMCEQITGV